MGLGVGQGQGGNGFLSLHIQILICSEILNAKVCHALHGLGGNDQFHQYDFHPELHRGAGRNSHTSQLPSIPLTFLYNIPCPFRWPPTLVTLWLSLT